MNGQAQEAAVGPRRYAVLADDLTGAGDAGVQYAHAGLRTRTLAGEWGSTDLAGADVIVVNTASRALGAEEAYAHVRRAAEQVRAAGAEVHYKKIDSTLRGPLGAEIDAVLDASGATLAVVCPAYPANGRVLRRGTLLVEGTPVAQTAAGRDPLAPVQESHLPSLLAAQTRRNVGHIERPGGGQRTAHLREALQAQVDGGAGVVVCDAEDEADLEAIALAGAAHEGWLLVGSAGLARPAARALAARSGRQVLLVCGSLHPAARRQMRRVQDVWGSQVAVLATAEDVDERVGSTLAVELLAQEAHAWLLREAPQGLFLAGIIVTGGDTLFALLGALGARAVDLEREVAPGLPLGRIVGGPWAGTPLVSKAGGFGGEEILVDTVQVLKGSHRERMQENGQ
jgi:uncharacterized protein YgbK (DUF1537 family)